MGVGYKASHAFWIWDSSNCHSSYWHLNAINDMPTYQIHHISTPHAWGQLGVLYWLYSQHFSMATWRLNCAYWWWWNKALHHEHLLLTTINVITYYKWYMCGKMPNSHTPFGPYGFCQSTHRSSLLVSGWSEGQRSSTISSQMVFGIFKLKFKVHWLIYISGILHLRLTIQKHLRYLRP